MTVGVAEPPVPLRVRLLSKAWYVSVPTVVVAWTVKLAQPLAAFVGLLEVRFVALWLTVLIRLMLSDAVVTLLPAASRTQTVIVDVATPFAGIGFGEAVAVRRVAGPKPVNDAVPEVDVNPADVAVNVQVSAIASETR